MFSDSDSDAGGEDYQLSINEHYAKAFEYKKEREELQKLKEKYGSDAEEDDEEETDSESDEDEDEDGEELTPAMDAAILRTLARIKRKDPEIYNSKTGIFEEEQKKVDPFQTKKKHAKDKSKPVTVRQVALEAALETGSRTPSPEPQPLTHAEEQRRLRDEVIAAFHRNDDDEEGDDFLVPREKNQDELEKEEEEYRTFLERNAGTDLRELVTVDPDAISWEAEASISNAEDAKSKKKKPKENKKDKKQSKEEADQEFLMSYIMNRGWIDRSSKRVPTYKEITSSASKGKGKAEEVEEEEAEDHEGEDNMLPTADPDLDNDDFDEIVDRFESSYNFRFEEPGADMIKQYPRNLESTVRREDTTRKDARKRKKERKEAEMEKRREEVRRMKALKMKELRSKLDKIGKEGDRNFQDDPALQELDLEGDWDPEAHDQQMSDLYGDDADYNEDEKPTWDDDIDIGDIYVSDVHEPAKPLKKDKKKKKKKKGKEDEAADGVDVEEMDADVEKDEEEWDGTEEMRKRKLGEYMDEIYGLEFNDMVGGMPTRFKYTKVKSETFALSPVEILLATDQELNEYMSIKKYAPYRNDGKWDTKRNQRLQELKASIAQRRGDDYVVHGDNGTATNEHRSTKKRMGKKERMKMKLLTEPQDSTGDTKIGVSTKRKRGQGNEEEGEKVRKKKSRHSARKKEAELQL
ncbi:Krr1-domain-containing protein [Marasmius fiardii PR-910]|nr:Krr1-domain-containing protein [Marasmius fiardii PR-910]